MADLPICSSLEVTFDLDAVGLVGGPYESDPSVHTWCSFNPHRIIKSQKLNNVVVMTDDKKGLSYSSPIMYTNREKRHMLNGHAYTYLFGDHHDDYDYDSDEDLLELANDKDQEQAEKLDFTIAQNTNMYRTTESIVYDLSDPAFHGHKTMRTDASMWLKLMAVSLVSGVPKIDENDNIFTKVKRDVQVGVCQLQLCDLYKEAAATISHKQQEGPEDVTFVIESSFTDPKLLNIEIAEIAERYIKKHGIRIEEVPKEVEQHIIESAFLKSRKAIISLGITLRQFDFNTYRHSRFSLSDLKTSPLNAYMGMRTQAIKKAIVAQSYGNHIDMAKKSQAPIMVGRVAFDPIMYNSMPGMTAIRTGMDTVIKIYCEALIDIDDKGCLYQAMNPNVKKLHMPQFISEQGKTPVVGYFSSHTPHTREYANEVLRRIELDLYDYDDTTERQLILMLSSSLRRHGMSKELFMSTIKAYFSDDNKSDTASGLFITVMKVISDTATFAANSVYYTADFRYQKLDDNATKLVTQIRDRKAHFKKIGLDSFDSGPSNGTSNADDCEGSANVACLILQCLGHGRYRLGSKWMSPLLNCAKAVMDRVVIFAVGATVTSIYMDNENKPIDMKVENVDLPFIGDMSDKNSQCDGHCFAILMMDAIVDLLLANGNLSSFQLKSIRDQWLQQGIVFKKRDFTVCPIILEGTGSVEPTILPIDEVYEHKDRQVERKQARAEITFLKEMKAKLNADKSNKDVAEMFSGEGVEFYMDKQKPNRRVSRFYREMIHGIPCNLYNKSEILSQIAFCKKTRKGRGGYEYGVNTGEFLRSGSSMTKEIALIAPFKDSLDVWQKKIVPIMESVQNHMPIAKIFHYTEKEFEEGIYSRFLGNPNALDDKDGSLIESMLESVSGNPDLAIVRLQTREWKLLDEAKVAKLNRFIMSFERVLCHGFFSEKHIINCDALVDILLVVKA